MSPGLCHRQKPRPPKPPNPNPPVKPKKAPFREPFSASRLKFINFIIKFKKLMEDGVITPEEFEKKKRQLLNL